MGQKTADMMRKDFDIARSPHGVKYDDSIDLSPENWVGFNLEKHNLANYGLALTTAFGIGPAMPPEWSEMEDGVWQDKARALQERGLVGMYIRDREAAYDFLSTEGRDGYAEKAIWKSLHKEFGPEEPQAEQGTILRFQGPQCRP